MSPTSIALFTIHCRPQLPAAGITSESSALQIHYVLLSHWCYC